MDTVTIERDETYNGWKNYETWNVVLWLQNEEHSYQRGREIVKAAPSQHQAELDMAEYVEEYAFSDVVNGPEAPLAGLASDLIGHSLTRVDWQSVVEAFRDE